MSNTNRIEADLRSLSAADLVRVVSAAVADSRHAVWSGNSMVDAWQIAVPGEETVEISINLLLDL